MAARRASGRGRLVPGPGHLPGPAHPDRPGRRPAAAGPADHPGRGDRGVRAGRLVDAWPADRRRPRGGGRRHRGRLPAAGGPSAAAVRATSPLRGPGRHRLRRQGPVAAARRAGPGRGVVRRAPAARPGATGPVGSRRARLRRRLHGRRRRPRAYPARRRRPRLVLRGRRRAAPGRATRPGHRAAPAPGHLPGRAAAALVADRGRQGRHRRLPARPRAPAPPPDRAHLPTLLLIALIVNQSDDWFTFPVEARAGHVVTLDEVVVHDSFGDDWKLAPPADWSLFATAGFDTRSLIVWATAATPLVGPPIDEVVVGTDEDANLVWAVELRLRGRSVLGDDDPPPVPPAHVDASGRPGFAYRPMTRIPRYWHPYEIEEVDGRRRYVQGRAADLSGPVAVLLPEASSDLLIDPNSGGIHPTHQLEPAAVPADGVRVERRAILARATDGSPVLWTQRRRQPLLTPPALALRFDVMEPVPPTVGPE